MQLPIQSSGRVFRRSLGPAALLFASIAGAQAPGLADPLASLAGAAQEAYLKAGSTNIGDTFGDAVAVSGDTIVVGVKGDDSDATGVNGDPNNNSIQTGAAYVFVRNGTSWSQQAYLKASNADIGGLFGHSVAIAGDTIVVGAPREDSNATGVNGNQDDDSLVSGAAYVFVRDGTTWSQEAYLKSAKPSHFDQFGLSVAVSGNFVVVGAPTEDSNATGVNGDPSDDSANDAGAAYVFIRHGTSWSLEAYLKASNTDRDDLFGGSVAVFGNTILVGAEQEDSSATGVDGDQSDNSANKSGAAYVFVRSGKKWTQQAYLKASNTEREDRFGGAVALSDHTAVIGAAEEDSGATGVNGDQSDNGQVDSGAVYVFARGNAGWFQQTYLKASNTDWLDRFGASVAVSDATIMVGAPAEDSGATGVNGDQGNEPVLFFDAGAAYVFARSGTSWTQETYLKASNTDAKDELGRSVALSNETAVIGAPFEDSNASGVNGNQDDNNASFAGAAYAFLLETDCVVLDFETEDDLTTPLENGQDISTPPEFGNLVAINASTIGQGPAIFDTDPLGPNQGPPFNDPDLLVDLGNVLIFQAVPGQTVPGFFDDPEDSSAGGTFFFNFMAPVEVRRLDLIDIDLYPTPQDAFVTLFDGSFRMRTYHAPSGWTEDIAIDGGAGFRTLETTTLLDQPGFAATATAAEDAGFDPTDVVRMEVFLTSSGAVDNIEICVETPDTPPRMYRTPFPIPFSRP